MRVQRHLIQGEERTVIGIVGNSNKHRPELEAIAWPRPA